MIFVKKFPQLQFWQQEFYAKNLIEIYPLGWNYIAFRVVFQEIYAADKKIYATAGRTGRAKYQLWYSQCYKEII